MMIAKENTLEAILRQEEEEKRGPILSLVLTESLLCCVELVPSENVCVFPRIRRTVGCGCGVAQSVANRSTECEVLGSTPSNG